MSITDAVVCEVCTGLIRPEYYPVGVCFAYDCTILKKEKQINK